MSFNSELWKESPATCWECINSSITLVSMHEILNSFFSFSLPFLYPSKHLLCILCQAQEIQSLPTFWWGETSKPQVTRMNIKAHNRLEHRWGGGAPKSSGRWEQESGKTLSVHYLRSLQQPSKERIILIFYVRKLAQTGWGNGLRWAHTAWKNWKTRPSLPGALVPHCPVRALSTPKRAWNGLQLDDLTTSHHLHC